MRPLRCWSARRIAGLWLAALLLEAGLIAAIRTYGNEVFAREHVALVTGARPQGIAEPDSARDRRVAADSATGLRFDRRMRDLIAAQQSAVAVMLVLLFATAGTTIAWAWMRVRAGGGADDSPPAEPTANAPGQPTP